MKLFYYLSILSLWTITGCTSDEIRTEQSQHFVKLFGTSSLQKAGEVEQTADNGYIFIGTTIGVHGDQDMLLVKVDEFGNESWQKQFGDTLDQIGNTLEITPDGGYILAGTHINNEGEEDIYLVKTDASGNKIWSDTIGDNSFNQAANDVKINQLGNIVLTGYTTAPRAAKDSLNPDDIKASNPAGAKDIFFAEISSDGTLLRQVAYGVNQDDYGTGIEVKSNGEGYIIVGTSPGNTTNLSGDNILVLNTNDIGDVLAVEAFGGQNNDVSGKIFKNPLGYLTITGSVLNNDFSFSPYFLVIPGDDPNSLFQPEINEVIPVEGNYQALSVARLTNNTYGMVGAKLDPTTNTNDAFYLQLGTSGEVLEEKSFGGSGLETATSIKPTTDGGSIILSSSGYEGNTMIGLIRVDAQGNLN